MMKICLQLCWLSVLVPVTITSPHLTVTMDNSLDLHDNKKVVSGATVRSSEFYREKNMRMQLILKPFDRYAQWQLRFDYLDIKRETPCRDHLTICQMELRHRDYKRRCGSQLVHSFCGPLEYLLGHQSSHSSVIMAPNLGEARDLLIQWVTYRPSGQNRGFQFTVTAFRTNLPSHLSYTNQKEYFRCDDGVFISMDLHCDNVSHCLDHSDEIRNCSSVRIHKISPGLKESLSCIGVFGGHCALYKYWLSWTLPLLAILTLALIALKGSRVRQRRRILQHIRQERIRELRENGRMLRAEVQDQMTQCDDPPPSIDCTDYIRPMMMPPPYSPRESPPPYKFREFEDNSDEKSPAENEESKEDCRQTRRIVTTV